MAITKQKKQEIIRDLEDKFSREKAVVFVDYSGVDAASMEQVRGEFRGEGIDMKIAKKTLISLVLSKLNINADMKLLPGQVAVIFGYKDEIAPAKIASRFSKEFENLKILGGIFQKTFVGPREVAALAAIPSREELLAKMVGSMQAPMSGFVNVMQGNIRGLVQVLQAISNK